MNENKKHYTFINDLKFIDGNQKLKQKHNMYNSLKINEQYKIKIENEIKSIKKILDKIGR